MNTSKDWRWAMYSSWNVGPPWMEVIDVEDVRQVLREDEVENDSVDEEPESSIRDREEVDDRVFEAFGGGGGAERATEARALATAVA
jgi:hypothetical protein